MTIRKRASKLGGRAVQRLLSNEQAMGAALRLVTRAQGAKKVFDQLGDGLLHQLFFASRGDYRALGKRLSLLKRRVKELTQRLS